MNELYGCTQETRRIEHLKERTCNKCGWVHFGVTRKFAEGEVDRAEKYLDSLDFHDRSLYGRTPRIRDYEHCFNCDGPYTDFSDAREGDCPAGCTTQAIIVEES